MVTPKCNGNGISMHVCALCMDLHIPANRSLKEKRAVVRHLLDTARVRYRVSAAEVDHLDLVQRCILGFATVSADPGHAEEVLDKVERFVWSHPELVVLSASRNWLESAL